MFVMLSRDSHLHYLCLCKLLDQVGDVCTNWVWSVWKKSEKHLGLLALHFKIISLTLWRKLLLLPVPFHSYFSLFLYFRVLIYLVRGSLVSRQNEYLQFSAYLFSFVRKKKKKEGKENKGKERRNKKWNKYMENCATHEQDSYSIYSQTGMVLGTNMDITTENAACPPSVRLECQTLSCLSLYFQPTTSEFSLFKNKAAGNSPIWKIM